MVNWFNRLQSREQILIVFAAVVLLLLFAYEAVWQPVTGHVAKLHLQVSAQRQRLHKLQDTVSGYHALAAIAPSQNAGNESLLAMVDRTSQTHQLKQSIKTLSPEGEKKVRLRMDNADFDQLIKWLAELSNNGLQVQQIDISRVELEGRVSVSVVLNLKNS